MAHVIWMGDFNAHLDQENSSTPHVNKDLLSALQFDLASVDPPPRVSLDHRKVNPYGRKLLQLCGDRGLTILNGCTPGDSQGYFTFEKGPLHSVLDYAIVSQSIWPLVRNFRVDHHNPIMSDHSLIRLELNLLASKTLSTLQLLADPLSSNLTGPQNLLIFLSSNIVLLPLYYRSNCLKPG